MGPLIDGITTKKNHNQTTCLFIGYTVNECSESHLISNLSVSGITLKRKCHHFDEIFITGCTESCQNDNFQCSQWRKFRQNDDISVSVYVIEELLPQQITILLCDTLCIGLWDLMRDHSVTTIVAHLNVLLKYSADDLTSSRWLRMSSRQLGTVASATAMITWLGMEWNIYHITLHNIHISLLSREVGDSLFSHRHNASWKLYIPWFYLAHRFGNERCTRKVFKFLRLYLGNASENETSTISKENLPVSCGLKS